MPRLIQPYSRQGACIVYACSRLSARFCTSQHHSSHRLHRPTTQGNEERNRSSWVYSAYMPLTVIAVAAAIVHQQPSALIVACLFLIDLAVIVARWCSLILRQAALHTKILSYWWTLLLNTIIGYIINHLVSSPRQIQYQRMAVLSATIMTFNQLC